MRRSLALWLARGALLAAFCALACATSDAAPRYRFDNWTTEHGLPQNTVTEILQTRDGYIWFTTFDGLVRYDGIRFVVFNKANSAGIATNRFTQLCEDADGALWVGSLGGASRFLDGRFTSFGVREGLKHRRSRTSAGATRLVARRTADSIVTAVRFAMVPACVSFSRASI